MTFKIKTSSWFTRLPPGHVRIGISRGIPQHVPSSTYRVYNPLAPGSWYKTATTPEYKVRYGSQLDALSAERVMRDLQNLADSIEPGAIPVICCYEKAGGPNYCHRAMAAHWLEAQLGIHVPELSWEDKPAGLHPLHPDVISKGGHVKIKPPPAQSSLF